ncbi:MAG: selenoneine biosynthesis selenosugar synthase SenB [Thiobacillus sp.]|jgi:putative glycosyltransferase (TIGR04348 family)|uniref:selenoneine biosynthesis selenosugar synthase SenB n=1 Tax=Thiobacillus sp. TaxID=924 RepID=UPI002895470C|nr:selenoneine biosynthesis selenosugar synthase SenB [Thiobacillus sp.]MDT3707974.1 selenoneine biosynthesis selenosugar synthase SenB [Thiobacillus sp.]
MRIALITPYGRETRTGNWHTAARWAHFLREAGHTVRVQVEWDTRATDLMLALHARRSFPSIRAFAERFPSRPLIVTLTGTDLYRDIHENHDARQSLEFAHRLIVLQDRGVDELPAHLAPRTRVIYQSSPDIARLPSPAQTFEVLVVGHLRAEKDPFRAALATAYLPEHSQTHVTHLGGALSEEMAETAELAQRKLSRWHWRGQVSHAAVLKQLARADLMVISSVMEGGANVVCEALAADVPVLASHMPGNIGMLGNDYPGYFPVGDERLLARLLSLAENDPDFYAELLGHCRIRRELMRPEQEASRLRQLVAELEQGAG